MSDLTPTPPPGRTEALGPSTNPREGTGADEPTVIGDRYEIFEEVGRGGMGAVLRGRDRVLNRTLAVKVLLDHFHDRPDVQRRFLEEAQIGGQLQHPGIVPVYEMGRLPDQRPFFTMKLVKGRTLAELLAERTDPRSDLMRFLTIFLQVCQTVAYAHSRRVIHRDLKPANVMVGAFGEVQVMDWGLAKVLSEDGTVVPDPATPPPGSVVETVRSGEESHAGSVLGTYAYMPPEQARGQVDRLDERCDVFGLGAVLCEILTGQPAHVAERPDDLRYKAMGGDLGPAFARLDACGADAELLARAKSCLAPEPGDRPRHAGEVAEGLSAYLAGVAERVRKAELAQAAAEARAEEEARARDLTQRLARQKLQMTRAVVGVAVVMALGTIGTTIWIAQVRNQEKAQREELSYRVDDALEEALRHEADASSAADPLPSLRAAVESARRAEAILTSGEHLRVYRPHLNVHVERLKEKRDKAEAQAEAARRDQRLLARLAALRSSRPPMIVVAPTKVSFRQGAAGGLKGAVPRIEDGPAEARLVRPAEDNRPLVLLRQTSAKAYTEVFREYGMDMDNDPPERVAELFHSRPPQIREELGPALSHWVLLRVLEGGGPLQGARAWAVVEACLGDEPRFRGVRKVFTDPASATSTLLGDPELLHASPATLSFVAGWVVLEGNEGTALTLLRRAVVAYPDDFPLRLDLATLLFHQDAPPWDEVAAHYSAALALQPADANLWTTLGGVHVARNRPEDAEACCERAVKLAPDSVIALNNLGAVLFMRDRPREAVPVLDKVVALDRDNAAAWSHLGQALFKLEDWDRAVPALQRATELNPDSSLLHGKLALVLWQQGKRDGSIDALGKAVNADPNNVLLSGLLGGFLAMTDRNEEAAGHLMHAIILGAPDGEVWANLTVVLSNLGRNDCAVEVGRRAVELAPDYANAHLNLGTALLRRGDITEGMAEMKKVLALAPNSAEAHNAIGEVYRKQGEHVRAIAAYREALRCNREHWLAWNNLAQVYLENGDFDAAVAEAKSLIERHPPREQEAIAWNTRGAALVRKDEYDAAVPAFKKALELDKAYDLPHKNLGIAYLQLKRLDEAVPEFETFLKGKPEDATGWFYLGLALSNKPRRDHKAAVTAYQKALALQESGHVHVALGESLTSLGRFADGLQEERRALELLKAGDPLRETAEKQKRRAERLLDLEARLPDLLDGKTKPATAAEALEVAEFCRGFKDRPAAATRFYAEAFRDAKTADELGHRYVAGCAAARAGCGNEDGRNLSEKERADLRRQALAWFEADLAVWKKRLAGGTPDEREAARGMLLLWTEDDDLPGVRDEAALAKLPEAERKAWLAFWAEVRGLLKP